MSRSKRKTPIFGHTTAVSEKEDKVAWHKAFRRAWRQFLDGKDEEALEDKNDVRYHSSTWNMDKDGSNITNKQQTRI